MILKFLRKCMTLFKSSEYFDETPFKSLVEEQLKESKMDKGFSDDIIDNINKRQLEQENKIYDKL